MLVFPLCANEVAPAGRLPDCASLQGCGTWVSNLTDASCFSSRWYQLVVDNVDDIAIIMSAESGKPVKESKVEATGG